MSKNLSKIPTLRGPNCNLRGSIPPCFPCCNASYPYSRVYRPHFGRCPAQFVVLCRSSCSCLDVNRREKGKLCGASDEVRPIHVRVRVTIVTTQETGRDTSAQSVIWTPSSWNIGEIFGHVIVIIKP